MEVPARGRALAAAAGPEQYWCGKCRFLRTGDQILHDKFHTELEAKARAKEAERSRNQKNKYGRKKKNKHGKKKGNKGGEPGNANR